LFYDRGLDGLPRSWIAMMKKSMRTLCPEFNSNRMVEEYTDRCYMGAALNMKNLTANNFKNAKALVEWTEVLRKNWKEVRIKDISHSQGDEVEVHSNVVIQALVQLGQLNPLDVNVQVYYGHIDDAGNLFNTREVMMEHTDDKGKGNNLFEARIPCEDTGRFGYTVRILPRHPNLIYPVDTGLISWA
jgi:starch phosphorylase